MVLSMPYVFSRRFMVSGLTFRTLSHFEFIFVYSVYEFYASLKLLVSLDHVKSIPHHTIVVLHIH